MNQSDGDKVLINAKKKQIQNKNVLDSRASSSGFHSFFRWFKKDDGHNSKHSPPKDSQYSNGLKDDQNKLNGFHTQSDLNGSSDTLSGSPSPSPTIDSNNLSKSSSCDSILSTATTGFAFVPPNYYQPSGNTIQAEKLITPGPYTDSYKRRLRQRDRARELDKKYELTLRKKYKLFSSLRQEQSRDYTLTRENQKLLYADLSLPNAKNRHDEQYETSSEENADHSKKHRRTVSDSSKDKKAGAYVHVKGKRKAPPPPPLNLNSNSSTLNTSPYGTIYSSATLARKKRQAPPPPPLSPTTPTNNLNEAISSTSLLDDKEIKAIIEGTSSIQNETNMANRGLPFPNIEEENPATHLTEAQKQKLIDNIRKIQQSPESDNSTPTNSSSDVPGVLKNDVIQIEEGFLRTNGTKSPVVEQIYEEAVKQVAPSSPISPRPWYKRPISGNKQDSAIPFKRDVVLKTMDKRKNKNKEKEKEDLPEVGYSRNSLFEGGTKLNFFSRMTEKSDDAKRRDRENEKRRSGIGIPNISELDREAAEIVNKENASKVAMQQIEDEKYYGAPEQLMLRTQMFGVKNNENYEEEEVPKRKSAKELISKFEASTANINRITVNTAFVARKEFFGEEKKVISRENSTSIEKVEETKEVTPVKIPVVKNNSEKNLLGLWTCPYCTLENPNWRIICEACERIKPYDKLSILEEPPLRPNFQSRKVQQELPKPIETNVDWEKKTEKVLKYFMPKEAQGNGLSKSVSETSVGGAKKPIAPSKLLGSPKFGIRNMLTRSSPEKSKLATKNINTPEYSTSNNKVDDDKLIESNAVVTTVTPVLFAPLASPDKIPDVIQNLESVNIEEIRNARIARFSGNLENSPPLELDNASPDRSEESENDRKGIVISNHESLEREKERLRDMIRAMNAKALAEKYPVIQKPFETPPKLPQSPKTESNNDATKLGAIKKLFVKKQDDDNKIINRDLKPAKTSTSVQTAGILKKDKKPDEIYTLPETVVEFNEHKDQLVLTNDVDNIYYELMDETQFIKNNTLAKSPATPIYANNDAIKTHAHVKFSEQVNDQVKQITNQLKSQQGLESFKATLKYNSSTMNKTNTLAINKILRNLENAICEGEYDLAAKLAVDLAKMKVSLSVTRHKNRPLSGVDLNSSNISINVYVEDKLTHKGPINITVSAFFTIKQLKEKFFNDFNIPIHVQRWIYEDQMATDDTKTLFDYGIYADDAVMYLYLVMSEFNAPLYAKVKPVETKEGQGPLFTNTEANILSISDSESEDECSDIQNDNFFEDDVLSGAAALPPIPEINNVEALKIGWECPLCTLVNPPNRPGCGACSESRPPTYIIPKEYCITDDEEFTIPDELKRFLEDDDEVAEVRRPTEKHNDLNKAKTNRKSSDIFNILIEETKAEPNNRIKQPDTNDLFKTSNFQVPGQNSIVMTAFTSSPNITRTKYRGVDNFNPNSVYILPKPKETFISTASPIVRAFLLKNHESTGKPVKFGKNGLVLPDDGRDITNHYMELVNLDNADLVANIEPFECPICFTTFDILNGIILRDCLHSFCKECLVNTIKYNDEAEVKCPYMDTEYSCESMIQEREIKALVSKEMYENHLAKSIRQAENKMENTFHCKTPNCRGWCIYEDNVNQFKCPVCTIVNCLTCGVTHDGLNCKQYQDRMNSDCDTNIEARRTKEMLQDMVDKGDAIICPTCQVVMMKKWGCDWLKCTMCKTEICWVTRGPRWGPGGKGDTTGGCKCGVDGKKCHPKCNYCH